MRAAFGAFALLLLALPARSATVAETTKGLEARPGLLTTYVDQTKARVLLALPAPGRDGVAARVIYQVYLRASLGSTPVGLDRNQPGPTQILVFRRVGPKVYAEFENTAFRAGGAPPDEQAAVADSFAHSTVWSGEVKGEDPSGASVVDITDLLTRDAVGAVEALRNAKQGAFHLDAGLSHVDPQAALAFPVNLEFEADETFTADEPGAEVRGIAPDPHAITLTVHHSLVKLPEPGFAPRLADPHFSTIETLVTDYAAPLGAPLTYRLAPHFRLEKTDPAAARSPVKKPIVFYVDRAAPEPVRSALVEGARWWNDAFEKAGYIGAFRVEVLPEGVNPLDARYNVINWVHRQTRGWSYGFPVTDPRTGEIVKGSVLLGSQRARQDILIYQGLLGAEGTGKGGPNDPIQIALARLRQLAVHETGHALGFAHNMAGSAYTDRGSVMDYPPPRVTIEGGRLDLSNAYAKGVGSWDDFTVDWLYGEPPPGTDAAAWRAAKVRDAFARGLRFVDDSDSRPVASAQPLGSLWDDGPDPVAALNHVMEVRRLALTNFGLRNLEPGRPVADLRRVIVPIYLFHRYEVDAAAKLVGGVDFRYAAAGDGAETAPPVSGERQRAAVDALLATVRPVALDLPEPLLVLLSSGTSDSRDPQFTTEVFGDEATPVFDLGTAAEVAADVTFTALLAPDRLNRLADQAARNPVALSPLALSTRLIDAVFTDRADDPPHAAEARRRVRARLVEDLIRARGDKRTAPTAKAELDGALRTLSTRLVRVGGAAEDAALAAALSNRIALVFDTRQPPPEPAPIKIPPGMPIGEDECWLCGGG